MLKPPLKWVWKSSNWL